MGPTRIAAQSAAATYSAAVVATAPFVFTAGQVGRNQLTNELPADISGQTRNALENLKSVLAAAGTDLAHVIRVLVFLSDLKDGSEFNKVYAEYFSSDRPTRTRVQAGLAPGYLIELEAVAVLPERG
jgi:2-iminobutanoate/2-iminopropanoate deaminase